MQLLALYVMVSIGGASIMLHYAASDLDLHCFIYLCPTKEDARLIWVYIYMYYFC